MSDLEANVARPKADDFLAVRITEDNLRGLVSHFGSDTFQRVKGKPAVSWCGVHRYVGETIVFFAPDVIVGIYDDEELRELFDFTGEKRPLRRPWPTADLIIINDGEDRGRGIRIEPGTIALLDDEGEYYTREYGWLLRSIDKIDDWTPIDPHKETP